MTQPEGQTARDIFPEDDGIPEVAQDDSPTMQRAEDPEFMAMPGESAPGQFGPSSSVLRPFMRSRVRTMSGTGMPCVMQTTRSSPASTASSIAASAIAVVAIALLHHG